jgi:hypothetical protein
MTTYNVTLTEDWVTFEAVWHTAMDERTCEKCMRLEGQTWTFPKLEGPLIDPRFGPVYDLSADLPLTHPNCRCFLEIRPIVELEKSVLFQEIQIMFDKVKWTVPSNIEEANRGLTELRANFEQATGEFRECEYIFYRLMSVINRMGLSGDAKRDVMILERMIMTVRILHSSFILLSSSTPYGWILGILSGIGGLMSAGDVMMMAANK